MATIEDYRLGPLDLDQIWEEDAPRREFIQKRWRYYQGQHDIVFRKEKHPDGREKTNLVTNWVGYIVNMYLGAISNIQLSYEQTGTETIDEEETEGAVIDVGAEQGSQAALAEYLAEYQRNNWQKIDNRLLLFALLCGEGACLHGYDPDKRAVQLESLKPWQWTWIEDAHDGVLRVAIRKIFISAGEFYEGAPLDDNQEILTVYTDTHIAQYHRILSENGRAEGTEWEEDWTETHEYKRVPVVVWRIDEEGNPLITDAILQQNDQYNEMDSAFTDGAKSFMNPILKIFGVDPDWVQSHSEMISQERILPLESPEEMDAQFLERVWDYENTEKRLDKTREHLHTMGSVPDIGTIVGATGGTSGIALKLKFTPMQNRVEEIIPNLYEAIQKRVEMLNTIWRIRGIGVLEDYDINIQFRMPVNRIEEWQNIANLDGVVSHRTQLRLMTDIEDPERELEAIDQEVSNPAAPGGPEEARAIVETRDRYIQEQAQNIQPQIEDMITSIGDAVTDELIRRGVVERIAGAE
jgi:hypothetical protein